MSSSPIVVQRDTKAWQLQVWVSFGIAVFLCAVGLAWLPGEQLEQAFMVMGYVFCLSAAFVLAKFVRDNESASRRGGGDTPMRPTCSTPACKAAAKPPRPLPRTAA